MKLTKKLFSELSENAKNELINEFSETGYNPEYLTKSGEEYSKSILDAEIVIYDGEEDAPTIVDMRVFDPYSKIKTGEFSPVYIKFDGWSNWLYDYRDNHGNNIDTIFDEHNGESQD